MTEAQKARLARLLPGGVPRWTRCYDNGGETIDRYTVVFTGRQGAGQYLAMNAAPFHPQGFGQHGETDGPCDTFGGKWPPALGRKNHLGTRIKFENLPEDCRRATMQDYRELWGLEAA